MIPSNTINRASPTPRMEITQAPRRPAERQAAVRDVARSPSPPVFSQAVRTLKAHPTTAVSEANRELRLQLQSDIARLGKTPATDKLQQARHHMAAEGRLLAAGLGHNFTSAQDFLEKQMGRPKHEWLNFSAFERHLMDKVAQIRNDGRTLTADDLRQVYNELMNQVVDKMTAYDHLYKEVLRMDLSASERNHVQSAKQAFGQMADAMYKDIEKSIEDFIGRVGKQHEGEIEKLEKQLENPSSLDDTTRSAIQWKLKIFKAEKNEFQGVVSGEEAESNKKAKSKQIAEDKATWKNGLASIRRDVFVDETKEKGLTANLKNVTDLSKVFVGAGAPQFIASLLHFGYVRTATDDALADEHFAVRTLGTGAALGASHKLVTDTVRAWTQLAMDNTIGLNLAPVSAMEVYPSAVNVESRNGELHPLTADEKKKINDDQAAERQKFTDVQSGSKFGTLSGDFAGFLSFGTAHAVRVLAHEFSTLNFQSLDARAVTSAIAGMAMAGGQAVAQATAKHDGIPTHITTSPSAPFGEQATKTWEKMLDSLKIWGKDQREELINRMGGATAGVFFSNALGELAKKLESKDAEKLMHEVGEYIQNNVQDLSGEQIGERIGLAVINFFQSHAILYPFFSNNQAKAEVASYNKGKDEAEKLDRTQIGFENIRHPGRTTLPHGSPADSKRRVAENTFNVLRGAAQIPVQSAIHPLETAQHLASGAVKATRATTSALEHVPGPTTLRQRMGGGSAGGTTGPRRTEEGQEEFEMANRAQAPFSAADSLERGEADISQTPRAKASGSRDPA